MLPELLELHEPQFSKMALAWLIAGARAFSVWSLEKPLACWPSDQVGLAADLREKIYIGSLPMGELRVAGLKSHSAQARLRSEAELISSLAPLERDLTSMAAELIDTRDQLVALYDLTQATQNCLEVQGTMEHLTREARRFIRAESSFLLFKTDTEPLVSVHHPEALVSDDILLGFWGELDASGAPYLWIDEENQYGFPGLRNLLMVPVPVRNAEVAVFGMINKAGKDFMSPDIKLLRAISDYAGAHIENVLMVQSNMELTRLQTEMELARRVQLSLLPKTPPMIDGLDIWGASHPASHVGGDFYDFIYKPDMGLNFVVGDISGKGMPAALLMAMTRTALRTETFDHSFPSPEVILRNTNRKLYDDFTESNTFATLFLGHYDPKQHWIYYANAGHSPVVFRPAGSRARLLKADGTPIGILHDSQSRDQCIELIPGDLLLVGTDGLNEARSSDDTRFGYERLMNLVEELADQSAQEIAEEIYREVNIFSAGEAQEDDQTLIILKRVSD